MFDDAIAAVAEAAPHIPEVVAITPGLVLHVDGDYLANYDGAIDIPAGEARQNALGRLQTFRSRIGAESIVVHNTSAGCQKGERYLIATVKPYQAQRSGTKPKNCEYLQDFFQSYEGDIFRAKNWGTREADDGMAACAHFAIHGPAGYAGIATADKDLRMLPGAHISWRTLQVTRVFPGDYDVRGEDGKQYGLKWFWIQMLAGDGVDNCPGLERYLDNDKLKQIGEKTAEKLLAPATNTDEACQIVLHHYSQGYGDYPIEFAMDRFAEQAALMWMRLGNDAAVCDFAHHNGHSRINTAFDRHVWAAVERLETRVRLAREQINQFGSSDDPLAADCSTAG